MATPAAMSEIGFAVESIRLSGCLQEILSLYESDIRSTEGNRAFLLTHWRLAGAGKLVILPADPGVEHGPARSLAVNPGADDPNDHSNFAIERRQMCKERTR